MFSPYFIVPENFLMFFDKLLLTNIFWGVIVQLSINIKYLMNQEQNLIKSTKFPKGEHKQEELKNE